MVLKFSGRSRVRRSPRLDIGWQSHYETKYPLFIEGGFVIPLWRYKREDSNLLTSCLYTSYEIRKYLTQYSNILKTIF